MNGEIKISWNTNFTMVPNSLWDLPELSHEGFRVYTYLIRLGASDDKASFPSYPKLAEKCQLINGKNVICKTKARRVVEELIKIGLVRKLNRRKKGTAVYGSNLYTLTHPDTLLNIDNTRDSDEWDIITDTPCVTPIISEPQKPSKIKAKKFDTPVSPIKLGSTEPKSKKSDTYKDLPIKDLPIKTKTYSFLLETSLDAKTKANINNIPDLKEEFFLSNYNYMLNTKGIGPGLLVKSLKEKKRLGADDLARKKEKESDAIKKELSTEREASYSKEKEEIALELYRKDIGSKVLTKQQIDMFNKSCRNMYIKQAMNVS